MTTVTAPLRYISGDTTITIVDEDAARARVIDVAQEYGTGTTAIQAAIDTATANWTAGDGPTVVYLTAGEWASTGTILMRDGVTLRGAGRESTTIVKTGAGAGIGSPNHKADYVFSTAPTVYLRDATIEDLTLDCTGQTSEKGIYYVGVARCAIRRVTVTNARHSAFGVDYPHDHTVIEDCISLNPGQYVVGDAYTNGGNSFGVMSGRLDEEDFIITNCTAIGGRAGVVMEAYQTMVKRGAGPRVSNVIAIDCLIGFENAGVAGATFDSCIAIRPTQCGFQLGKGDHGGLDKATGAATINNSLVLDSEQYGVEAYFDTPAAATYPGMAIQGCVIHNSASHGVYVTLDDYDVSNLTIRGNTITENGGGITITKAAGGTGAVADLAIVGNEIIDNTNGGISLDADLTRGHIEGNNIIDTTGTAQPTGLSVPTGRTLTGTVFEGGLIKATTPVPIVGTLTGCHVGHVPGWTRGAGAPTVTAPLGTIYQRTDGTTGSLLYVNTDGSTTWSAFA